MKTSCIVASVPARYSRDSGDPGAAGPLALTAAGAIRRTQLQGKKSQEARLAAKKRVREQWEEGRLKYTARTQPRDSGGKFRRVLARLKVNLGDQASEQLAKELEAAESAGSIGDYQEARRAGAEVVKLVDGIDAGTLDPNDLGNVRAANQELGKLLSYLPLPQGDDAAKVRFSDLPAPTASLIQKLIDKVEAKLDPEKANELTEKLKSFQSGVLTMSADELSQELARLVQTLV